MNFQTLLSTVAILAIGAVTSFQSQADSYRHEFSIDLQSIDRASGVSGYGQAVEYTIYPRHVAASEYPYAEAAFVAHSPYVTVAFDGAGLGTSEGTYQEWDYAAGGRLAFAELPYFGEAQHSRLASWFNPYVLSTAADYNIATEVIRLTAGMYVDKASVVDVSIARSTAEVDPLPDVSSLSISVHGRTLLPVVSDDHLALELAVTRTSSETGSNNLNSYDYDAKFGWYFNRAMGASAGLGTGIDLDYPLADYRTREIAGTWFLEPELLLSLKVRRVRWYNDTKEEDITLHFVLRL